MDYDSWDENNFERDLGGNKVRKWNQKEPTLEEEVAGRLGNTLVNGILNLLVAPFHAINPAIYSTSEVKFKDEVNNLSGYCLFYQYYPDMLKLPPLVP